LYPTGSTPDSMDFRLENSGNGRKVEEGIRWSCPVVKFSRLWSLLARTDRISPPDMITVFLPFPEFSRLNHSVRFHLGSGRDEQFQCKYWRTVTFLSLSGSLEHWLHWHRFHRHSVSVSARLNDRDTECRWNRCQCNQCSGERFTETAHP
jgi:hypothetical protein